jgi:PPM family protein phosphatase
MSLRHSAAGKTDVGRERDHNEDHLLIHRRLGLYVVADGMGGNNAGEVASALATTSMKNYFEATEDTGNTAHPSAPPGAPSPDAQRLVASIKKANGDIFEISRTVSQHRGMGSTIVAAFVPPGSAEIHVANVGDSRCYRIQGGRIEQLTRDHSLVGDALAWNPNLTERELAMLPKNIISRALGLKDTVDVDVRTVTTQPGDVFLLCSDGLSGMVKDPSMLDVVARTCGLEAACDTLIGMANEAGGTDNITVLLVRIEEQQQPAEDAAPAISVSELSEEDAAALFDQAEPSKTCPACGRAATADEVFCGQCGASLG